MKIYSIYEPEFAPYGKILPGYDLREVLQTLEACPAGSGVEYVPSEPTLEALPFAAYARDNLYGGMAVQLGWCNGTNTRLNCLEYHRDSEVNIGTEDFILLLAKAEEIVGGVVDTAKVKAFRVPKGVLVEVYGTTLHYAPCSAKPGEKFRVMVVLPKGTNCELPHLEKRSFEDGLLWARNKWLLAHKDSDEAAQGAYIGLVGENIDIEDCL